jgi:hypothetical protein
MTTSQSLWHAVTLGGRPARGTHRKRPKSKARTWAMRGILALALAAGGGAAAAASQAHAPAGHAHARAVSNPWMY